DRPFGGNAGADAGGRQEDPGRAATPTGSGADGGALPEPTALPAVRGSTADEGHASPAADVAVWRRGGSCTPVWSLPMRRGVAPEHHPCRGDHGGSLHAGV